MDKIKKGAVITIFMILIVTIILIAAGSKAAENGFKEENNPSTGCLSTVEITKPKEGYLYVFDREIAPIGITLVLGKITIEVETTENVSGVDIYIDDALKFSDYTYPYSRLWNERVTGRHVIRAVEHGGNESDEISLFIFNFVKPKPSVVVNEIMSDPSGGDAGKEWIELYNAGESEKIKGWTISNADGNAIATLPNWVFPNDTYLVINFGNGINDEDFSDGNGTFYVGSNQEFFDNTMGECALYTGEPSDKTIIDFIAYCYGGNYTPGTAYGYAMKAGIWNEGEYFNPMADLQPYSRMPIFGEGDSIGRNAYSNDTNMPDDWDITGGKDAFTSSMGRCNYDAFGIVDVEMPAALPLDPPKKKWTIMVYMADCDLEPDFFRQLNELENVGTNNDMNIVFQIDGYNQIGQDIVQNNNIQIFNRTKAFRGFLYQDLHAGNVVHPQFGRIPAHNLIWAHTIDGEDLCIGEIDTGSPAPLTDFINWVVKNAPADHYVLILGGHGAGWKGCMVDEGNGNDWLYMEELRKSLDDSNIITFDILGFDLCMMAMVEVGYQIRFTVDYMVASEELDMGWNYEDIFEHLQNNIDMTPEELASYMVDSYDNYYRTDDCRTLSAIRLKGDFQNLVSKINIFAQNLKSGMEDWGDTENKPFANHGDKNDNCQMDIRSVLLSLFKDDYFDDANYKDLYVVVNDIGNNGGIYQGYKQPWNDILNLLVEGGPIIINEIHGWDHSFVHGLSIYFPRNEVDFYNIPTCCSPAGELIYSFDAPWPSRMSTPLSPFAIYAEDHTTQWGKVPTHHPWQETPNLLFRIDTQWDEFLHRYYKPCADAGRDQSFEVDDCSKTVAVTLNGGGSSSADDDKKIHRWIWDLDSTKNTDNGDWDKDGIDEANDDKDIEGETPTYNFGVGVHHITLTVWDDHYLKDTSKYSKYTNDHPNEHWKTDQDTCVITVTCKGDETPPTTIITSPPDGTEFDVKDIVVVGNATDNVGITQFGYDLKWKDGEINASWPIDNITSYHFEFEVELHNDWNEITVYAKDAAGNEGNDSVKVYYYPEEDTTPPVTTEEVGQPSWENGYVVTPATPIWLNATDDSSGVANIHYEVWSDEDGDNNVDTMKANITAPVSSVEIHFAEYEIYSGIAELHFYATDNAGNIEEMNVKQHLVQGEEDETTSYHHDNSSSRWHGI